MGMKGSWFAFLSCLYLLIPACVETIQLDPMEQQMPVVVNCVLERPMEYWYEFEDEPGWHMEKDPPVQHLDLYHAKRPSADFYEKIEDAQVTLKRRGTDKEYEFRWNGDRWECAFLPGYNAVYDLQVITAANDTVSASAEFPHRCRIAMSPLIAETSTHHSLAAYCYVQTFVKKIFENSILFEPQLYNGEYFLWLHAEQYDNTDEKLNGVAPVGSICTNHPDADDFNVRSGSWKDFETAAYLEKIFPFDMRSYNEHSDFLRSSFEQMHPGEALPFYINYVEEGSWDLYRSLCLKSCLHDRFVRIHHVDGLLNTIGADVKCVNNREEKQVDPRSYFTLEADFDTDRKFVYSDGFEAPWVSGACFSAQFVSEDYDRYLRDVINRNVVEGDEFASRYSTTPVHSNISGGIGIFGCSYEYKFDVYGTEGM